MDALPTLEEIDALVATERRRLIEHLDTHVIPLFVARHLRKFADSRAVERVPDPPGDGRGTPGPRPAGDGPGRQAGRDAGKQTVPRRIRMGGREAPGGLLPDDTFATLRLRHGAHRHLLAALEAGPRGGLAGKELNAMLMRNGYSLDSAEVAKTSLGHAGVVTFTPGANVWALTDAYREAVAGLRPIEPDHRDAGRCPSPEEHTGGRIVLRLAMAAGDTGITREQAVAAVMAEGYSRSLGKHGYHGLTVAGILVPAPGAKGKDIRKVVRRDMGLGGNG